MSLISTWRKRTVDHRRRRFRYGILVLAAVLPVVGASCFDNIVPTGGPQGITPCQEGPHVCLSDGGTLTVYRHLGPAMSSATYSTLYGSYNTTDVGPVHDVAAPKESGSGETDIIYKYYSAPMYEYGITIADDNSIGNGRSDQFYIYFNSDFLNSVDHQSWYGDFTRALACHETGHAVGLTHGYNANPPQSDQLADLHCMRRGMYASLQTDATVGPQNVAMINSVYS